jgi:CelD/BcsL family acetyltransferase involved in cellulose biosynthesis
LRSRKKNIQSTFSSVDIREFHKSLWKRINNSGWLSLRFLKSEKKIIAASYNFNYQGRVFSYQKGMDPEWERYGPGKAIVYEAIREAFLTGSKEYNFLRGNEEYKSGWTRECRPLFTVTIYNSTVGGRITGILSRLRNLLKKVSTRSPYFEKQ